MLRCLSKSESLALRKNLTCVKVSPLGFPQDDKTNLMASFLRKDLTGPPVARDRPHLPYFHYDPTASSFCLFTKSNVERRLIVKVHIQFWQRNDIFIKVANLLHFENQQFLDSSYTEGLIHWSSYRGCCLVYHKKGLYSKYFCRSRAF